MDYSERDKQRKAKYAVAPFPNTVVTKEGPLVPKYFGKKLYEYDDGKYAYYRSHTKNRPLLALEIEHLNAELTEFAKKYGGLPNAEA